MFRIAMYAIAVLVAQSCEAAAPAQAEPGIEAIQPAPAPVPFMVRLLSPVAEPDPQGIFNRLQRSGMPRPDGAPDDAAKARLQKYYSVLSEKLRAVPGLQLITESTPGVPGVPYEISIRLASDWRGVNIEAMKPMVSLGPKVIWKTIDTPDPILNLPRLTALWDDIPADNPDRDMESLVERMRLELFPPDRAFLDQKMSKLRDPRLDTQSRRMALFQLITADSRRDSFGSALPPRTYRPDPALLAAATEVAMSASDPALRDQIWGLLTTPRIPRVDPAVLVAPAVRALGREADTRVLLTLINILSMSARDDRAREALGMIANSETDSDRPQLVRMAARRVLNGGAGWNDYLVARLSDLQVSDAERIELINYTYSIVGSIGKLYFGDAGAVQLDKAAERSLATQMKKLGSTDVALAAVGLLRSAGSAVTREEFINYLRSGTGQPQADIKVRRSVLSALAYELRSHPELREIYEDIGERDLDTVMRAAARQALDQTK